METTAQPQLKRKRMGLIRVGKLVYDNEKKKDVLLTLPGFETIVIKNYKSGFCSSLSPYFLKTKEGYIMENVWQFSKVYPKVYPQTQYASRWHYGKPEHLVWKWGEEHHFSVTKDEIKDAYWKWRDGGFNNPKPVRYPNGYHHRSECQFSLWKDEEGNWKKLDYVTARAKIYAEVYAELARNEKDFKKLAQMVKQGTNILLLDVDGPRFDADSEPYDQVENSSIEVNENTLPKLLANTTQPFCHCYVLAGSLLELENVWKDFKAE